MFLESWLQARESKDIKSSNLYFLAIEKCNFDNMRLTAPLLSLLSLAYTANAASSWSFEDATLTVQGQGAGVGGGVKEKYAQHT